MKLFVPLLISPASSSSRPGTVSTLTDELMTLQNHMKECEKTISDIERKLRLVAELSGTSQIYFIR